MIFPQTAMIEQTFPDAHIQELEAEEFVGAPVFSLSGGCSTGAAR